MTDGLDESLTFRVQIIAAFCSISLVALIIYLIRNDKLKAGYGLLWLAIGFSLLFLSIFSKSLFWLASTVGIYYAPAALFLVLIIGLILISIHFSITISKHQKQLKTLAQEHALLKNLVIKTSKTDKKTSKL